jgi:secreted Zn-dependent insulinase-like peptidase
MPLPSLVVPSYELILPSTEKPIKYRPFLVKEEKLLLLALESGNNKEITTAIKTIITNCIQTKGIKVENLPTFDIEYLFLNIRAKSVGEEIELSVICPDDEKTEVPIKIDLEEIKVKKNPDHTNKIELNKNMVLELKYPSLDQFISSNFNIEGISTDQAFDLIVDCIDKLYDKDEVYVFSDYTKDEWKEFIDQMNSSVFKKIETFFETMPKLAHEVEIVNPETKVTSKVTLEGLSAFFTSQ